MPIFRVIAKHWRSAFGGISIAVISWVTVLGYIPEYRAVGFSLLLWAGGFIHRKIDPMSLWSKNKDQNDESISG